MDQILKKHLDALPTNPDMIEVQDVLLGYGDGATLLVEAAEYVANRQKEIKNETAPKSTD